MEVVSIFRNRLLQVFEYIYDLAERFWSEIWLAAEYHLLRLCNKQNVDDGVICWQSRTDHND